MKNTGLFVRGKKGGGGTGGGEGAVSEAFCSGGHHLKL